MVKNKVFSFILAILSFGIFSCQSANCRPSPEVKKIEVPTAKPSTSAERILIYKFDGTLQCGQGREIPVADMKKDLSPIIVYQSFKKNDGQMRIQVCGAASGMANVFEIDRNDLTMALKKGFKEWTAE